MVSAYPPRLMLSKACRKEEGALDCQDWIAVEANCAPCFGRKSLGRRESIMERNTVVVLPRVCENWG